MKKRATLSAPCIQMTGREVNYGFFPIQACKVARFGHSEPATLLWRAKNPHETNGILRFALYHSVQSFAQDDLTPMQNMRARP